MKYLMTCALACVLIVTPAGATERVLDPMHTTAPYSEWNDVRADAHAPIAVMGDHNHEGGEIMLAYRYMFMEMDGNRSGTSRLSPADVIAQGFAIAPTRMTMDMHMFGLMYGVNHDLTLMAMLPWISLSMDHLTGMGGSFTTKTEGIGDAKLSAMYALHDRGNRKLLANVGVGIPTGSIEERDTTPAGPNQPLPYPMQLGSGTYDLLPGLTFTAQERRWSWGAQAQMVLRLGRNSKGYSLGDRGKVTAWMAYLLADWVSASVRLDANKWGNIDGVDEQLPAMAPMMVPTADPDRRGGERVDALLGVNLYGTNSAFADHRLALEVGVPVYQSLDGPQLETDFVATLGWQYLFR